MPRTPTLPASLDVPHAILYIAAVARFEAWMEDGKWYALLPIAPGPYGTCDTVRWSLGRSPERAFQTVCWVAAQLDAAAEA